MIITLQSLMQREAKQMTPEGAPLGKTETRTKLDYSEAGMWAVLASFAALAAAGLGICIIGAARDNLMTLITGVAVLMLGGWLMMAAVKEKANLEIIRKNFVLLSAESRDEFVRALLKTNASTSRNILNLIEKLFTHLFK